DRRRSLRALLVSAGEESVEPILSFVGEASRAEIVDEAERVLADIARNSHALFVVLSLRMAELTSAARATVLRALVDANESFAQKFGETFLNDRDPETRDAAAWILARRRNVASKNALERRLQSEQNPVVIESIRTALEELENGLDRSASDKSVSIRR